MHGSHVGRCDPDVWRSGLLGRAKTGIAFCYVSAVRGAGIEMEDRRITKADPAPVGCEVESFQESVQSLLRLSVFVASVVDVFEAASLLLVAQIEGDR